MSDTLAWIPTNVVMPILGSNNKAIAAAVNLVSAINHPAPATALTLIHNISCISLQQLVTIFADHTAVQQVPILSPPPRFTHHQEWERRNQQHHHCHPSTLEGEHTTFEDGSGTTKSESNTLPRVDVTRLQGNTYSTPQPNNVTVAHSNIISTLTT